MARLPIEELAELSGSTVERISTFAAAGLLARGDDGRFPAGDVHRVRLAEAFLDAGIPLDAISRAVAVGAMSFAYYDRLHPDPGALSSRTYADFRASLEGDGELLPQLHAAFGLAEPPDGARLPVRDELLIEELVRIARRTGRTDLALRVVRLLGDATRRTTEAVMTVYDEATRALVEPAQGLPSQATYEAYLQPWTDFGAIAPRVSEWLTARHLTNAIDAYSVTNTEYYLAAAGFVPKRDESPPAVAFVDLTGFTQITVERGDERVARMAIDFARLAEERAAAVDGRVVKLLGDGVLLRFGSPPAAVEATLRLLDSLADAGLPAGHAGIAAGPIIARDGDIFGRTVNLASRIADVAGPGELLAPPAVAERLEADRYRVSIAGSAELQGLPEPIDLVRIGFA